MTSAWQRRRRGAEPEPTRAELPPRVLIESTAEDLVNGHTAETPTALRETGAAEVQALVDRQFARFRQRDSAEDGEQQIFPARGSLILTTRPQARTDELPRAIGPELGLFQKVD
jgi:hypothetical protein